MLEKLKEGLRKAIDKLRGTVDKSKIDEMIIEIQRALLASDVDVNLVFQLSEKIRKRALEEKPKEGLTLKEHTIYVVFEELANILGKEAKIKLEKGRIMLVGLFGSGKTTTAVKLANFYRKKGMSVAVTSCDTYRPAAMEQLEQLAKKANISCFLLKEEKDPRRIATIALEELKKYDIIIFDTAGRDALDEELAKELVDLANIIKPIEILLVVPADLGQVAGIQAQEFNKLVGITGIIVTKLDSTAKGGGALTSARFTDSTVKFITVGEKIDDIELYDSKRFVSRLLGFGDMETLMEKVKEVAKPEIAEKIIKEDFDLEDFCAQIEMMQKTGPIDKILEMLGLRIPQSKNIDLNIQEKKMEKWKHIVKSMTIEERKNPEIIDNSRVRRIARGSGVKEEDVRELLSTYKNMKKMMKVMKKPLLRGGLDIFKKFKL
ncbi:MAG: signal recognition particle receptor subunit alpha [Candidatus Aenigmatarchaeota archaeon]|nr:signal recognition particle receptor subunit alpha [Candidatus Aenigmarchaeota archaeon]